jgi:succinate dehydrogenase / fumarate reductase membrane anchor subunit
MSLGKSASALGKVRGLGSAEEGGGHWISERVTSIALVILGAWLMASLLLLPDLRLATVREWLSGPSGAIPMTLLVATSFIHGLDGMKVVVDDYVENEGNRFAVNLLLLFLAIGGAAIALFALARIAFGGAA